MMFQKSFPIAGDPPLPRIVALLIIQGCQRNKRFLAPLLVSDFVMRACRTLLLSNAPLNV
jgi:hypothetical protein